MKKPSFRTVTRRSFARGAAVSTVALGSGCYGSFGLTDMLYDWNTKASGDKFVRALIFFALVVIPVYGLFLVVDAVILNTIEFWTGSHPVRGSKTAKLGGGRELTSTRVGESAVVRHELREDGKLVRVVYARKVSEREVELLDEHMQVLTRAVVDADGKVHVHRGEGPLAVLDGEQLERAAHRIEAGELVSDSVRAELAQAPLQSEALAAVLAQRG